MKEPSPGYSLLRCEQEVVINWDSTSPIAHIYSLHPPTTRKLDKLSAEFPETYICESRASDGGEWDVPIRYIKFRKPASAAQVAASKAKTPFGRTASSNSPTSVCNASIPETEDD